VGAVGAVVEPDGDEWVSLFVRAEEARHVVDGARSVGVIEHGLGIDQSGSGIDVVGVHHAGVELCRLDALSEPAPDLDVPGCG
jgi:coenzyme F420-reducing hydrogenase beta subunit